MYGGKPVLPIVGGGILLPNTGGSAILTVIAFTGIAAGAAILLSGVVRMVAKKAV